MAKPQRWSLTKEGNGHSIRRWNGKTHERLPVDKYRRMRGNVEELRAYVSRLNYQADKEARAKLAVSFKHAFINDFLIEDYREFVIAQVPTRGNAEREVNATKKHFIEYFAGKMGLPNPLDWHGIHKTKWKDYLVGLKHERDADKPTGTQRKIAPATLRMIIQGSNRFIKWLHERRPAEVPPLKFEPISRAGFRQLKAVHEMDDKRVKRKFISEEEWNELKLSDTIAPLVHLCYRYGLRRSEALALRPTDVLEHYLYVQRQIGDDGEPAPLKGREPRKTPHWYSTARETYDLICKIQKMHPDTFGDRFKEDTGGEYTLHDLRHTFITRAVRKHDRSDVMLAVGHKNSETTDKYLKDDRALDDTPFKP